MKSTAPSRRTRIFSFPALGLGLSVAAIGASAVGIQTARADDVTLTAGDAINSSSFNAAGNWSDSSAPSGGNDYFTNNFRLRSPTTNNQTLTFAGSSLTVDGASGEFLIKSAGSTYNAAYKLDGGLIWIAVGGNPTSTVGGTIELLSTNGGKLGAQSGETLIVSAAISGSGVLEKNNNGTVILNGANTYTGETTLTGGFLQLGSADALGNTTAINFKEGVLRYTSANTTDYSALIAAGTSPADVKIDTNGQDVTFATPLTAAQSGGFDKRGAGTLTLSTANNYTGTTFIRGGELHAPVSGALGTGAIDIGGGSEDGRLGLSGGVTYSNNVTLRQRLAGNNTVHIQNVSGNNELTGTLTGTLGGQHIRIESAAGQLTLSGATAITSDQSGRDFYLQGAGDGVVGGVINNGAGNLDIFKEGAGKWTLSGTNTYTGTTTVRAGTLLINGDNSAATGAVTVDSGATLGGSGTIGGATTINGTLAPGNSPGIMTYASDLTLGSSSVFEWELFSHTDSLASRGAADGYDAVDVGGNFVADGLFRIILGGSAELSGDFWKSGHTWFDVFDVTGSTTDNGFNFELWDNGAESAVANLSSYGSFSFNSADGSLTWSAVPEPGSALAGLLIAAGLLRRRRCRA